MPTIIKQESHMDVPKRCGILNLKNEMPCSCVGMSPERKGNKKTIKAKILYAGVQRMLLMYDLEIR